MGIDASKKSRAFGSGAGLDRERKFSARGPLDARFCSQAAAAVLFLWLIWDDLPERISVGFTVNSSVSPLATKAGLARVSGVKSSVETGYVRRRWSVALQM
jgi:hypothetical protein